MKGKEMYCSKCNAENKDDAKFCSECGAPIESKGESRKCSNCGADLDEKYGFCPECGMSTDGSNIAAENCESDLTVRFCRECGSELNKNAAFCGECGASIETVSYEPKVETVNACSEERTEADVESFDVVADTEDKQTNSLDKKKMQMLIAGIGVVILCIAAVWFIKRPKKIEYEPQIVQEDVSQEEFEEEETTDSESGVDIDLNGLERVEDLPGTLEKRDGESYMLLPEAISLLAYESATNTQHYLQDVREIRLVEQATGEPAFMDTVEGTEISVNGDLVIEEGLPVIYEDEYVSEKRQETSGYEESPMDVDINSQMFWGNLDFENGNSYLIFPEENTIQAYDSSFTYEQYVENVKKIKLIEYGTEKPAFTDMAEGLEITVYGPVVEDNGEVTLYEMRYVSEVESEDDFADSGELYSNEEQSEEEQSEMDTSQTQDDVSSIKAQETKHVEEVAKESDRIETKFRETSNQSEWTEYSFQLYSLWDDELNRIWGILENKLDSSTMDQLRQEQNEWIKEKEAAMEREENMVSGGSAAEMNSNLQAVAYTRARVFELLEYIPE